MTRSWPLLLALSTATVVACNPFHHEDPVQVNTKDETLNSRWHANLASPADLAGAVQMNGTASMAPAGSQGTTVVLDLANATPGGQHPWALHRGQCGSDQGLIGSAGAYPGRRRWAMTGMPPRPPPCLSRLPRRAATS